MRPRSASRSRPRRAFGFVLLITPPGWRSHLATLRGRIGMKTTLHRGLLAVLAATGIVVGVWAYFAPRNFYDTFPGGGLSWLPQLGPYNEHFCKDVGGMYLALTLLTVLTIVHITNTTLLRITAGTWITFNGLHFIYHLTMLHMYSPRDRMLNVIVLSALLLISVVLLIPARRSDTVLQNG